jgi:endonuclease/exonuclease/phosphatase family metal-dependent hydrolase
MMTLRQVLNIVEPAPLQMRVRDLARLLETSPSSLRQVVQAAEQYERIVVAPLKMLVQNMALMVAPAGYAGVDRDAAVRSLISHLQREPFDVVGLCECFANDERGRIKEAVAAIFPYSMEGPSEGDIDSDGGLLLLSRHPITQSHTSIFRVCYREDCLADKGILHAHIEPPGLPTAYDVFLTHLQNPDASSILAALLNYGPGSSAIDKIRYQLDHVHSFIQACSSPECPALLMGDLNVNAAEKPSYDDMCTRLGSPTDVWGLCNKDAPGYTLDDAASFDPEDPPRPVDDPERHKRGQRVDYFWSWRDGQLWRPYFDEANVVLWEASPGRQLSDHYGVSIHQAAALLRKVDLSEPVVGVSLKLDSFHCLRETGGTVPVVAGMTGDDEVQFNLAFRAASGTAATTGRSEMFESVDSAEAWTFPNPPALHVPGDPGDYLDITVTGWEVDEEAGIETGRVTLGPGARRLGRAALLWLTSRGPVHVAPSVLYGDGGEYVAKVEVSR